jgi:ferredoxin
MLMIDPGTCIDCDACVPLCPINAIYHEDELPPEYAEWAPKNADLFQGGVNVTEGTDPLPTARLLEEIQEEERKKGWKIPEPAKAS